MGPVKPSRFPGADRGATAANGDGLRRSQSTPVRGLGESPKVSAGRSQGDNNNVGRDFGSGARTNFYGASKDNLDWFHLIDMGGATCRSCHFNTHGNQSAGNTTYRIIDGGTNDFGSPPIGYKTRNVNFPPSVQPRGGQAKPIFRVNVSTRARACLPVCRGTDHDGTGDFNYVPQAAHGQPGQDNDPLTYTP